MTGKTSACFEPAIDYIVVKLPKWPFDKFVKASRLLGTQMKATGEAMAIGQSVEECADEGRARRRNRNARPSPARCWTALTRARGSP